MVRIPSTRPNPPVPLCAQSTPQNLLPSSVFRKTRSCLCVMYPLYLQTWLAGRNLGFWSNQEVVAGWCFVSWVILVQIFLASAVCSSDRTRGMGARVLAPRRATRTPQGDRWWQTPVSRPAVVARPGAWAARGSWASGQHALDVWPRRPSRRVASRRWVVEGPRAPPERRVCAAERGARVVDVVTVACGQHNRSPSSATHGPHTRSRAHTRTRCPPPLSQTGTTSSPRSPST